MNGKLFGAIVLVGAAVGAAACRTQLLDGPSGQGIADLHAAVDQATLDQSPGDLPKIDMGKGDLQPCCDFHNGDDLSACIPVLCMLI